MYIKLVGEWDNVSLTRNTGIEGTKSHREQQGLHDAWTCVGLREGTGEGAASVTGAMLGLKESWKEAEAQHPMPESESLKSPGEDIGEGAASVAIKIQHMGDAETVG